MDSHIIDCLIHPPNIPFTTSRPLNHWEGTKPQAKDSLMVYPTYLFSYSSMVPLNFLAMCSHAFFFVFFFCSYNTFAWCHTDTFIFSLHP